MRRPQRPLSDVYPDLNLRYEWIRNQGVAVARNAGLSLASANLVAFLADDYVLPTDYLSRAEDFFRRYADAQVITFNMRSVGASMVRHVQQLYQELVFLQNAGSAPDDNEIIRTFSLPASRAAIFRREMFDTVGPFDERLRAGEDGELGKRMASHGIPLYFMHRYYIEHLENKGFRDFMRQRKEYATSYYNVLAKSTGGIKPRWTLSAIARTLNEKLLGWAGISWRHGKLMRFFLLWPGLALFLLRFYLTVRQLERADRLSKTTANRA